MEILNNAPRNGLSENIILHYHNEYSWCGGHFVDLNHGQNLGHLSFNGSSVKQSLKKRQFLKKMAPFFLCKSYLLEVKRMPFTPPKVDMATKMGMRKAKWPNILSAKVTATASEPRTSGTDKVV